MIKNYNSQLGLYADVMPTINVPNYLTYAVPLEWHDKIELGMRVVIGIRNKKYTAVVSHLHQNKPFYNTRPIDSIIDIVPTVPNVQLLLYQWIVTYYMCSPYSVISAALPSALKLSSDSIIFLNNESQWQDDNVNETELQLIALLKARQRLSSSEISESFPKANLWKFLQPLFDKRIIVVDEQWQEKYKSKTLESVEWDIEFELRKEVLPSLNKSPKQQSIILAMLSLTQKQDKILKKELLLQANATASQLHSLIEKGILKIVNIETERVASVPLTNDPLPTLSFDQDKAMQEVIKGFASKNTCLLYGVTGSGKTNIYLHLAKQTIAEGKKVLYLMPEIALTFQITNRVAQFFGSKMGVYHSKYNAQEKVEIWNKCLHNEFDIVVGPRSILFLPMQNIGLIIVDEEHDSSYKQQENPMYNARDAALYLAKISDAKILLGSGSPSVESYYLAQENKYNWVQLDKRYYQTKDPDIEILNITEAQQRKLMKLSFTDTLIKALQKNVENNEQSILFQNRRGYASYIQCQTCAHVAMCKNCDVALTYHKQADHWQCHYCQFQSEPESACQVCGTAYLVQKTFGTERIEEDLQMLLPNISIARMDTDTTRKKHAHQKILQDFQNERVQVLIGTQMVTKGLDFEKVSLVAVLLADSLFYFPDFRANERSMQLLLQLKGRAGRKSQKSTLYIQTHIPQHPVLQYLQNKTYLQFLNKELHQRLQFYFPPFVRLIVIVVMHAQEKISIQATEHLSHLLKQRYPEEVQGYITPSIARIRNFYIRKIMLKIPRNSNNYSNVKSDLATAKQFILSHKNYKGIRIEIDVDPN